ncbi:hypothetical protein Trydic_g18201 [Trypoxylus dichotomus]
MLLLLSVLLALVASIAETQSPLARTEIAQSKSAAADYLLPGNLKPSLYEIELEPDFDTATFNGSIRITVSVSETTSVVVLHTNELTVEAASISLFDANGKVVNSVVGTSFSNDDREFYSIFFKEELLQGNTYLLVINSFTGVLNDKNSGFYLAKYTDEEGNQRNLATTQFEPTSARKAFPCFDEPALKAQFDITIVRSAEYKSISNTAKISTDEISQGRFQDRFARTVVMSTYLIAFVVCDFDYVADANHRVFLRPVQIANARGDYALRMGIDILDAIANFVDVPYSLDKMDQIGIPEGYFAAGAMENWGLVTYREQALVYANRTTDAGSKEGIATIISHEFGHQWFGNLVSPKWWSYLWLNEGFATYLGHYGASVVEEDMELMDKMVVDTVQYALRRDASTSTRPMSQEVGCPRDISSLFDTISYDKSGSVIRMVEGVMSTGIFATGLNLYLRKMQFDSAQPSDLYSSLQEALDKANVNPFPNNVDMAKFMATWDSNAGYPLVTVTRNYEDGSVLLSQRRFLTSNPNNNDQTIWYVPISYGTASVPDFLNRSPKLWLTSRNLSTTLAELNLNDWLLVNIQETGYYRVNYDLENWNRISDFLNTKNFDQIHKLNRAQLLDDSFVLAQYGVVGYEIPLNLIRYVQRETEYIPLYPFMKILSFLDPYMQSTAEYNDFKEFVLKLLNAAMTSVGCDEKESDRHTTKLNRIGLLTWTGRYGNQACREIGLQRLREWESDEVRLILPNMQTPLTCSALRIGEQKDWDFVFQRYVAESESLVRARLLDALGCSENVEVLNRFMDIILDSNSDLRSTDSTTALSSIYNSGIIGRDFLYNYIKNNWARVNSSRLATYQINAAMNGIAVKFSTQQEYDDLYAFGQQVGNNFSSALHAISSNINWSAQNMPTILSWLNENVVYK